MHRSDSGDRPLHRQTWAEIDLGRLQFNFQTLKGLIPAGQFFCPMIKANAYGHGDVEVARALRACGATHLGVSLLEEGLKIRASGDRGHLLTFGIFEGVSSAQTVVDADLTPVVAEWQQLEALDKVVSGTPFKIHLKFNTGMNRLGFQVEDSERLREWLKARPKFQLEGIASHLLRGDDAGAPDGESASQLKLFIEVCRIFEGTGARPHILNSSAEANLNARVAQNRAESAPWPVGARPGIALYGIQPSNDENIELSLKPVLRFVSHLIEVRHLKTGERVSYGATWRATRDSVIGVVPAGYADGIFRGLSNRGDVLVRGQRARIAGIVCMDFFMIDLTDIAGSSPIERGEEVILIGEQENECVTATEWAAHAQTIPYEVLTRISGRVPRIYVNAPKQGNV